MFKVSGQAKVCISGNSTVTQTGEPQNCEFVNLRDDGQVKISDGACAVDAAGTRHHGTVTAPSPSTKPKSPPALSTSEEKKPTSALPISKEKKQNPSLNKALLLLKVEAQPSRSNMTTISVSKNTVLKNCHINMTIGEGNKDNVAMFSISGGESLTINGGSISMM